MTLDEFAAVARDRIPTPAEFIAFVNGQGYSIRVVGERASLVAPIKDPVSVPLARMLGREPFRSNVLAAVRQADNPANVERPAPPPVEPAAADVPRDPNGEVIRAGRCVCPAGGRLPWAVFHPGAAYEFEECRGEKGQPYYRVFAGGGYGVVCAARFGEMFREE